MTATTPSYVTFSPSFGVQENVTEMRHYIENGVEDEKISALKRLLVLMSNGDPCDDFLMPIIRFVLPLSKNKLIKKLLSLYFELCPKIDNDGRLRQEMILVW
jgi:coatomer subunit beta